MDLGLKGKVVIVTGAGRGIGREIARTFAEEGAIPVIADIAKESGEEAANDIKTAFGVKATAMHTDITNRESVKRLVESAIGEYGRIDVLVNNATVIAPAKFFKDETWEEVDREISVIYQGCLNCMKAVIAPMTEQKSGCIISILTDAARIGEPRMANYGGVKGGVGAFSRALAKEVAGDGIRVNCVSPSMSITELWKARREDEKNKLGEEKFQDMQRKRLRLYPLGRFGEPGDISSAVAFLASERASWVTGQTLSVNGGYAIGPW